VREAGRTPRPGQPTLGMIYLLYGPSRRPLALSGTRRYLADELFAVASRARPPYWLLVEGTRLRLGSRDALWLGCQVAAAYRNSIAQNVPPPDGFEEDMAEREARVQQHMEAESSSDEAEDYVTSDQDMDYPTEFYI